MGGWGGLIEIVFVLSAVIGWGEFELRSTRLDKKAEQDGADKESRAPSPAKREKDCAPAISPTAACGTAP